MNRLASLALVALLSAGCAAGPKFAGIAAPVPDRGDVYVYRASSMYGIAQAFDVTVNGQPAGRLANASYLHLRLPAGTHTVTVAPGGPAKPMSTRITPRLGATLFYQWDFDYDLLKGTLGNADFPNAALHPRERDRALADMQELGAAK